MAMATFTSETKKLRDEFSYAKSVFDDFSSDYTENLNMKILSMGMTSDYLLAIKEGSNMIRVGSAIFGPRH